MPAALRPPAVTAAAVLLIVAGADAILAGVWFFGTLVLGYGGPCGCFFCGLSPVPVVVGAALIRKSVHIWNGGADDVAGSGVAFIVFGASCLLLVGLFGCETVTLWRAAGWSFSERRFREAAMVATAVANAVAVIVAGGLLCRCGKPYVAWRDEFPETDE